MKRFLLSLAVLAVASIAAQAQTLYRLGFCDGRVTTDGVEVEGNATFDAAIELTSDDLSRFAGNSFAGVNAGLTTKLNAHSLTVWVRETLDGANLAEATIDIKSTQKPRDGWNNVRFETPLTVESGKSYFVGYSVTQARTSSLAAYVDAPHPGANWMRTAGGAWSEREGVGAFCIEALLDGDNLPQNDIALVSARLADHDYIISGQPFRLTYEVRNTGLQPIYSYVLNVTDTRANGILYSKTITGQLAYGVSRSFTETIDFGTEIPVGTTDILVFISDINSAAADSEDSKALTLAGVPVIKETFPRTVLLEEFTTERCPNCPGAAQTVHDMLEGFTPEERERIAVVCHHSGYYTDDFTQPCDERLVWFYNDYTTSGQLRTYAPAFMLDRRQAYSDSQTPVFTNLPVGSFSDKIAVERDNPALVCINITGEHNSDSRKVKLNISGSRVLDNMPDPRVTVYVVENDVRATSNGMGQSGSGGREYWHQHLIRAYNEVWGASPEWDGDDYTYTCELEYPEGCKTADMQVIAFISNYNGDDPLDCVVGNTAWTTLSDLAPLGVEEIEGADADAPVLFFDLSGRRVEGSVLLPGVYVRKAGSKAEKIIILD